MKTRSLGLGLSLMSALGALELQAQGDVEALGRELGGAKPPPAYFEFVGRNPTAFRFSSANGWVRRARAVAAQRAAVRAAPFQVAPRGPGQRATFDANGVLAGDLNIPVLLVLYANTDSASLVSNVPRSVIEGRLYGTDPAPPYSIHTYYREISDGRLLVNGTVLDWKRVSRDDTHYEGGCNGLCGAGDVGGLIVEMVQLHDSTLDFGQFDNDGADGLPNSGDDDGFVDALVLVHPEVDGACGAVNAGASGNIWAHRATLQTWGASLATDDPAANGGNIRIRDYIIQGGQGGDGGCADGQPQAMGVVAHETGHLLGLPDLYNTLWGASNPSEGIGHWGLMGSGNWRTPTSPAHMGAWSRAELGWVTEVLIDRDTTLVINTVAESDTVFVLPIAGTDEYFLLANRQPFGSDAQLWGPGLLVWHVDSALVAQRFFVNQVNAFAPEAVALEQADGLGELQLGRQGGGNRGDANDAFPGGTGSTAFGYDTTPSSARNDGTQTFVVVDSISQVVPGGAMRARIQFAHPTLIAATDTLAVFRLDGIEWNRFLDVLEPDSTHQLDMDSIQVTADGRSRFTWVAWSNAQPRMHSFTSSANGDTILATVDADFLLRVSVQGAGGSVSSEPVLDVEAGAFVRRDDVVSLIAETTQPGTVFDGWGGDQVSLADTLVLSMDRPYDLTATFADVLVVTEPNLPAAVMGSQYQVVFSATGGNGSVVWEMSGGALPSGLSVSPAGVLSGVPAETGDFTFDIEARSGSQTATRPAALSVVAPSLAAEDVVAHLVEARVALTEDDLSFLDLLGNRNGRFDVGDFLAWVAQAGAAVSPELIVQSPIGSEKAVATEQMP